eukprot:gene25559-biopygen10690
MDHDSFWLSSSGRHLGYVREDGFPGRFARTHLVSRPYLSDPADKVGLTSHGWVQRGLRVMYGAGSAGGLGAPSAFWGTNFRFGTWDQVRIWPRFIV